MHLYKYICLTALVEGFRKQDGMETFLVGYLKTAYCFLGRQLAIIAYSERTDVDMI